MIAGEKYKDSTPEVKKAHLLCEVLKEMPLFLSDNAIFVGTQRDAFAKSYALINPSFAVEGFSGYCDPMAIYNDIEPNEEFTKERIDKVCEFTAKRKMVEMLNETYGDAENYTKEVIFFVEQVTGHVIPDFRFALKYGVDAMMNEAKKKSGEFYEATAIALGGVKILADRYIELINKQDNYDSNNVESNDMAPIVNLFNEWHPKETSKKVRAVFRAKAERGERVSSQVPYGYTRDESTPIGSKKSIKLVIDEEAATVVREIYRLCASGLGPTYIAHNLKERKILKPSIYSYEKNGKYGAVTDATDPYGWNDRTIAGILDNEVYIGNTINLKATTVSYKNKRKIQRPEEEWIRVEGTHEAIIDIDTWEIVRRVREGKRRRDSMDGINKYSGLLHCADCGQKLYFVRGKTIKPEALKSAATNTDKFVALAKKHIHIEELTPEVLLTFVSKIVIHERSEKRSKSAT